MPAILILDLWEALALHGPCDDQRRLPAPLDRFRIGGVDLLNVVSVNLDRAPAKRSRARRIRVAIPAQHRLAPLPKPVHIEDADQVVELVMATKLHRLPDRAFRHLAIAEHDPYRIGQLVQILARKRQANADWQTLTQRPSRHINVWQHWNRMPLYAAAELPQRQHLLI